jgi:hypothetical protein
VRSLPFTRRTLSGAHSKIGSLHAKSALAATGLSSGKSRALRLKKVNRHSSAGKAKSFRKLSRTKKSFRNADHRIAPTTIASTSHSGTALTTVPTTVPAVRSTLFKPRHSKPGLRTAAQVVSLGRSLSAISALSQTLAPSLPAAEKAIAPTGTIASTGTVAPTTTIAPTTTVATRPPPKPVALPYSSAISGLGADLEVPTRAPGSDEFPTFPVLVAMGAASSGRQVAAAGLISPKHGLALEYALLILFLILLGVALFFVDSRWHPTGMLWRRTRFRLRQARLRGLRGRP